MAALGEGNRLLEKGVLVLPSPVARDMLSSPEGFTE